MRSSFTAMVLALAFVTVTALPANSLTLDDMAIINGNSIDARMRLALSAPHARLRNQPSPQSNPVASFPSRNQPSPQGNPVAAFPSRNQPVLQSNPVAVFPSRN